MLAVIGDYDEFRRAVKLVIRDVRDAPDSPALPCPALHVFDHAVDTCVAGSLQCAWPCPRHAQHDDHIAVLSLL